jgi:hypothetical protein
MIVLAVASVVAFVAACTTGESEDDLRPGPITIGIVQAAGEREKLAARGVQVAALTSTRRTASIRSVGLGRTQPRRR